MTESMSLGECEVCGKPASVIVLDVSEAPPHEKWRRFVKKCDAHSWCEVHQRGSRTYYLDGHVEEIVGRGEDGLPAWEDVTEKSKAEVL